ncbi:KISS1R [Mytilus edulis]|uniref:KISS1R n=1 Tax=Mytilus edulis TaxID=6550 RepID=A0A8S3UNK2_MYTED|nr:KISS1R [Mytilus edulis]
MDQVAGAEYQTEERSIQNKLENIRKDNKNHIVVEGINNLSIDAVTDDKIQAEDIRNSNSGISSAKFKSNSIMSVKVVEDQSCVSSGYDLHTDMTNITPSNKALNKTSAKNSKRNKRNRQVKNKFSAMFIAITSVSLFCYMPVGVIILLEGVSPDFWDNLSSTEFIVVAWLYHTHIINSIINPIIYAFLDTEFYTGLKALFADCCKL